MALTLIYVTENCKQDAHRFNNIPLENVKAKIRNGLSCLQRFEDSFYVLKKCYGYDNRLVAYKLTQNLEVPIDGHSCVDIYLLLRILKRGDKDYEERFSNGTLRERQSVTNFNDIDWDDVNKFVENELHKPTDEFVERCVPLSDSEKSYLYTGINIGSLENDMVFESKEWVEMIRQPGLTRQLGLIGNMLGDFFTLNNHDNVFNEDILDNDVIETIINIPNTKLYMLVYTLPNNYGWFLAGLDDITRIEDLKKDTFSFFYSDTPLERELIMQKTRRVYPSLYLAEDSSFWMGMEQDPWGNYALSGEELKILRPKGENQQLSITFPLFINGRAGSGKSTILQYLFTEFLISGMNEGVSPSLYLSYSKELVDNAKSMVMSLIVRNVERKKLVSQILESLPWLQPISKSFDEESKNDNLTENKKSELIFTKKLNAVFSKSFFCFQDLLFELVPVKYKKLFQQSKYWNFSKFKQEWSKRYLGERTYSAAICWHIIRTYIKGWYDDEYCTPENFKELGVDSVSQETFEWVYTNVWENWYKPLMNECGIWDDQDLVRFCLNPVSYFEDDANCPEINELPETYIEPRFSGIFCDESQDFTQIELAAIIGLSIFSNRRITSTTELERLPFVFAGDEFQTLNPTGFSWSSLRKTFTTRLIHRINQRLKGADKPCELQNNYRSSRSIVRFSNRIQLLRRILFDKDSGKDIAPQKPWDLTDETPVLCFSPMDSSVWYKLQQIGAVVIIPCEEGQNKEEYLKQTDRTGILRDIISFDENGASKGITLLTPAQAKGMEYPIVAICGFESSDVTKIVDKLLDGQTTETTDTRKIEYKYWINNVYVAITRAKKQLIILDPIFNEDEGYNKNFWKYAYKPNNRTDNIDFTNRFLSLLTNNELREKWNDAEENLGFMLRGSLDKIGTVNKQDILDTAKSLAENGHRNMDSTLMSQAAAIYQEIGGAEKDVHTCYGYMNLFQEKFENAYDEFKKIGENDLAIRSIWLMLGKEKSPVKSNWEKSTVRNILNLPENSAIDAVEKDFANLMNDAKFSPRFLIKFDNAISRLIKEIEDNTRERFLSIVNNSNVWSWAINVILNSLDIRSTFNKNIVQDLQNIFSRLESLINHNLFIDTKVLADWAFLIAEKAEKPEYYQKCVDYWNSKDTKDRKKSFYLSMSHLKSLEEWFDFMGQNNRWKNEEKMAKDMFDVLRKKKAAITNFDKLTFPGKRLYVETIFSQNQNQSKDEFRAYAIRIKNAAEYEKLASFVKTNSDTMLFCQRLKTITQLESFITSWIKEEEFRDSAIQKSSLINSIDSCFQGTVWVEPLKTILNICDIEFAKNIDEATYKKQAKNYLDENWSHLAKLNPKFRPFVLLVAGCVVEKSELFMSRVMFDEWARDLEYKSAEYNKKVYGWFRRQRGITKYKLAEHEGDKEAIIAATEEIKGFNIDFTKINDTVLPDLSDLYTLLTQDELLEQGKNKVQNKHDDWIVKNDKKSKDKPSRLDKLRNNSNRTNATSATPTKSVGTSAQGASSSKDAVLGSNVTQNPLIDSQTTPLSKNNLDTVNNESDDTKIVLPNSTQDIPTEEPTSEISEEFPQKTEILSESIQETVTATFSDIDTPEDDGIVKPSSEETRPTVSEPESNLKTEQPQVTMPNTTVPTESSTIPTSNKGSIMQNSKFQIQMQLLVRSSKLRITLNKIENNETVNTYSLSYNYGTQKYSGDGLLLEDNRIVLEDGTRTPYIINQKSTNEIIVEEVVDN